MVDQHPPGSPLWWLAVLDGQLRKRQRDLKRWDRYFSGAHPMAFATAKYREAFADLLKPLADNWTPLIVRAVRERLHVDGFRYGEDPSADGDANYFWQANGLDFESGLAHTEALVGGVCYGLVDPTVRIGAQAAPQVTIEHPSQVIVATSPESRRVRLAGLKRWRDDFGRELATVYLPERVFRYERQLSAGRWVARSDGDAEVGNPFGVVPLVPLERRERLLRDPVAEFDNVIPLQDACNKLVADMMVAAEFAAFFQRWATGVEPVKDAEGNDVLPFSVGADRMFWSENHEARFGQFQASDLNNYVVAIEMVVQHMAALSSTPPHYLLGKMANLPLALDTIVPVPGGRSTMGDLRVGDKVFAPDGTVQSVVGLSPIYLGRPCYRLRFDDGSEIVADADHKWETTHFVSPLTNPYRHGVETSVVTTEQIAGSLKTCMGTNNHFIPVAAPHDGPAQDYVVDPYVLGVWLGDGDRINGVITQHVDDADELAQLIEDCGEPVRVQPYPTNDSLHVDCRKLKIMHDRLRCPRGHARPTGTKTDGARCPACAHLRYVSIRDGVPMPDRTNEALVSRLKRLGVWRNKHIPESYFHGSAKQRLALLQGIMDTDGSANRAQGSVELSLHDERLASDVHRLVQSLGHKAALREGTWQNQRFGSGRRWRMSWSAPDPVFRLSRKAALQRTVVGGGDGKSNSPFRRYVVACDPVASVPVRCINVTSESHLFCVTDAFIATHNSGDALAAAETGLVSKCLDRQRGFEESWEEIIRLCFAADGDPRASVVDAETIWRDAEHRTEAEQVDAAIKRLQFVPVEQVWLDAGYSPRDVVRFKAMLRDQALERMLTGAVPLNPVQEARQALDAANGNGAANAVPAG